MLDTEASVMANFEFLAHTDIDMEEEEQEIDELYDTNAEQEQNKVAYSPRAEFHFATKLGP